MQAECRELALCRGAAEDANKYIYMKIFKDMKTWKTVIQFIITVLTAIVTTMTTTSCMAGV